MRLVRHIPSNCIGRLICDTTNDIDGARRVLVMWHDGTDDAVRFADLTPVRRPPRRSLVIAVVVALVVLCLILSFLAYL